MSDLGPLHYLLGLEVSSMPDGIYLSQDKYVQDLLSCAALIDHRTVGTPMELGVYLLATDSEPVVDPTQYRYLVDNLVYLGMTRPDISHVLHIFSQFVAAPTQLHYTHLLHLLRYLHGTISRRRSSPLHLQAYSNTTWASNHSDRRSPFAFFGSSLIAWKTKKQTIVSSSSAEAELRAMATMTAEVTWLQWLLGDFGVTVSAPTPLSSDSTVRSAFLVTLSMNLPSILVLMLPSCDRKCTRRLSPFACAFGISVGGFLHEGSYKGAT